MKLTQLLAKLDYECLQGNMDKEVNGVVFDSRKVVRDSLFVCVRGAVVDGHIFAGEVAAKGASVIVAEEAVEVPKTVTVVRVEDSRYALALLS